MRIRCHLLKPTGLRQAGLTMAEMIVAMAVGLLLAMFAAALLLSSQTSYALQNDAADVDDAGRYAIHALAAAVRQTAYVDWVQAADDDPAAAPALRGLDARTLSRASEGVGQPSARSVNGSDVLTVRFQPAADGTVLNCAGFPVADAVHGWSIFYVAPGTDGEGELLCKYRGANSWSADAIVRGVDSFQVLYGVDTDTPRDGTPNRYLTATQIDALDDALPLAGGTPEERARDRNRKTMWKRVVVLRFALLMHGSSRARHGDAERRYDLFGPDYDGRDDPGTQIDEAALAEPLRLRERHVFTGVVMLRNQPW